MNGEIFLHKPRDFHPTVEVSGCFCICGDKALYLKRHPGKPQGNSWGLPAGKLEKGEAPRSAAVREVYEEVGIQVRSEDLEEVGQLYIRLESVDYIFYMFRKRFEQVPEVILETDAFLEARWLTLEEALQLPLIIGGKEAIKTYQSRFSSS